MHRIDQIIAEPNLHVHIYGKVVQSMVAKWGIPIAGSNPNFRLTKRPLIQFYSNQREWTGINRLSSCLLTKAKDANIHWLTVWIIIGKMVRHRGI